MLDSRVLGLRILGFRGRLGFRIGSVFRVKGGRHLEGRLC